MKARYSRLPIHRKLVVIAMTVTGLAMLFVFVGLVLMDGFRYRAAAVEESRVLARVIASNTAAAVAFDAPEDARAMLAATATGASVVRACIYRMDGSLFAAYARWNSESCPASPPIQESGLSIVSTADISGGDRAGGVIYIERDLAGLWTRLLLASGTLLLLLTAVGLLMIPLAHRLTRPIATPIVELARAARETAALPENPRLPRIDASPDEVGELVMAFSDMLRRVSDANESLRRKETEREGLLERERRANRLKDEFLAAVSHELRTPLNAMLGWAEVASQSSADSQLVARAFERISRNARAQKRVIDDLVDVARIVAGKLSLRMEVIDLRDAVAEAAEEIRPLVEAKHARLNVALPDEPCVIRGDRDRVHQIVSNLLSNSEKFTATGGSIDLAVTREDHQFVIVVRDTGIGIPPEFLPFVFDRFRQADGSTTREHGGLGLGLAIVKEIATLHGGAVEATSPGRGGGATFLVRIPAFEGDPAVQTVSPGTGAIGDLLSGVRVLAVDDNRDALALMVAVLEGAGARVTGVLSGTAALETWQRDRPDVLLSDLAMPEMDGFELLRRIRALEAGTGHAMPAIAVSAHASERHRALSEEVGFVQHVTKPYDIDHLVQITRWAAGSSSSFVRAQTMPDDVRHSGERPHD